MSAPGPAGRSGFGASVRVREAVSANMKRLGKRLLRSEPFLKAASWTLHGLLRFIYRANRPVAGSQDLASVARRDGPLIIALWHGQQLLVPFIRPEGEMVTGLVSRSDDAEINARVLELAGNEVVRGSGGRVRAAAHEKGGARALIALRGALRRGRHVVMIADISKGEPRRSGLGVIQLAKISGRPIVPLALATSRHYVVDQAWDRTTINLPFGRRCLRIGAPIRVAADADEGELARARQQVTDELNRLTDEAYALAGERK